MALGRPRSTKTPEERRQAKILYMRDYHRKNYTPCTNHVPDKELRVDRSQAQYDPLRDGPLQYGNLTAQLCGDPPIGRSALDKRNNPFHLAGPFTPHTPA